MGTITRILPQLMIGCALLGGGWWLRGVVSGPAKHADEHGHDEHAHGDDPDTLDLSPQARKNIGLEIKTLDVSDYERTVTVPGILREPQGRSELQIAAPLSGSVQKVLVQPGEAVSPDRKLFEVRLTHEELVQAQGDLLKSVGETEVTRRELTRLEKLSADGSVAGKQVLERKYELEKQEAILQAQRQALVLHGLSEKQVEQIIESRSLLQSLVVSAPPREASATGEPPLLFVQDIKVTRGQHVEVGDTLAVLADHAELVIEGNAFEKDLPTIQDAVTEERELSAIVESKGEQPQRVTGLKILYVEGQIDPAARTVHFYVSLKNELLRDETTNGVRRVDWKYRPGQRVQLLLPVEKWKSQLVVPAAAVAQDGIETYVFQAAGDQLKRRAVHVRYRDPLTAVLANDGSVFPGDKIAVTAAQQLQIAVKNKSGGAVDPHAGHNH